MDTLRVDICYRPLRIGWAIRAGNIDAFRKAVRLSHTLWGGRYNPIVVVDHEEEATRILDVFRVDLILPIGDSEQVKEFPKRFPYLIKPFFIDTLFIGGLHEPKQAQVLDIHNALVYLRDTPEWKAVKDRGFRVYAWQADDPLADLFIVQLGAYPTAEEIGIDYQDMLIQAAEATECAMDSALPIPLDVLDHPTVAYLPRHGLSRHYSVTAGWDWPGFFLGDITNVDDLVCHWNLRAADIPLWFVDPKHLERYSGILPAWEKRMREMVTHRPDFERDIAVWSRRESIDRDNIDEMRKPFGDIRLMACPVSIHSWNGRNIRPPMMHFGQVSTLGVVGQEGGKSKVSFSLNDKPFCADIWFHTQHLVASISFVGGLYGDEQHTLNPPFIPELNEFYARTMHFEYDKLRIEPEGIGLIIDAADTDTFLYGLPVAELFEKIFGMAGFSVKLSSGGLIARQLIARLGGLHGADLFKIPGVRRLLKTHGPTAAFTKRSALQLIGGKDPANPNVKFEDPFGRKLEAGAVFSNLVEKGLYRIGRELTCPNCRMNSWVSLDVLEQKVVCELCGHEYDATTQLVDGEWHYRRSGLLGAEKNAQGAIPVILTLHQLKTNMRHALRECMYSPSLNLESEHGAAVTRCEVDLAWLMARPYPSRTAIILGECKDQGIIDANDIDNLRRVADALPRERFEVFVLLAKLCPFTPEEIVNAKTLNDKYQARAILLTARELEPWRIYDRAKAEFGIDKYAGDPEDLAQATAQMYFREQPGRKVNEEIKTLKP